MIPRSFELVSLVVLILQPFFETQSCTNFVKFVWAIYGGYGSPWVLSLFCLHGSMGFRATMYGSPKSHFPWLKCHTNEEKIENYHVLINDHRIKTTQPISLTLVSFVSEDNVLFDERKNAIFSNIKVTKIEPSTFSGTPGIVSVKKRKKKRRDNPSASIPYEVG